MNFHPAPTEWGVSWIKRLPLLGFLSTGQSLIANLRDWDPGLKFKNIAFPENKPTLTKLTSSHSDLRNLVLQIRTRQHNSSKNTYIRRGISFECQESKFNMINVKRISKRSLSETSNQEKSTGGDKPKVGTGRLKAVSSQALRAYPLETVRKIHDALRGHGAPKQKRT